MIETDREPFAAQMTYLAEAFSERITPVRIAAYFMALRNYEIEYIRGAVEECIKIQRFFPKPVEIQEQCARIRGGYRRAIAAAQQKALPAVAAGDEDLCAEVEDGAPCLKTVAEHRAEFRALVEQLNSPALMERLRLRPSYLERRGIHALRPGVTIKPEDDLR